MSITLRASIVFAAAFAAAAAAHGETVEIYSAGSLRNVVNELGKIMAAQYGIQVQATFGGSGLMRGRIEQGEKPDLFLSADLGSPQKLTAAGRTLVPTVVFARNRICIVSRRAAGITSANLVERMLKPELRIKTSKPVADPAGDYAWSIFDRIEALRPGKGRILKEKAERLMEAKAPAASAEQSPTAALFAADQIDLAITYCSATASLEHELSGLTSFEVPAALDPHPLYGLALLSNRPEAMRVALFLLSEDGQSIVAKAGLVPLLGTSQPAP